MAFFDDLPAQDLAFTGGRARKEEEEGPGLIRGAGDSALALGQGVVTGVKMMSDAAGAGNDFSAFLGAANKYLESLESDQRQAEKQRIGELIKQAEASGSPSAEIAAYLAHFTNAPLDTILNAAGTAVPTIGAATVGTALTGGVGIPAAALAIGTGAVQGAGVVKGAIYDRVKEDLTKQGLPPEEVEARAQEAQSYGGENKWLIAGGAGLGAVAGRFGVEGSLIGRMAGTSSPNVLRRAVGTGVTEAVPEGFQGGQEQYASNIAAQREGIDTPTWRGVAGSAALESVAGGGLGTVAGAVMPPRAPVQEEPPGPLTRAAEIAAGVEAGAAAAGAAPTVTPPSDTAGPASMGGVPDSVFSAFPDLTPADSGLIPLHQFTKDEQDALRAAGLVQTGNLESGEQHEGVDPERLWPERQRRATAAAANRAGVSEEDRASGIEKRARMYERLAEEQEALGDLGDQAKAAEYRNKAAAIRSGESIRQPSAAEIAAGVEAGAAAAGGSDPTAQAGTQDQAPERSGNLAGPRSAELALAAMQQQADADIAGLRVRGERVQGEPSNPIVYTEPNPTLPEAGFNPREGSAGALFEDIEEATFNAVSDADRLRAAARTDERTEAERLPATTQTARMLDDNTIDGDALVRTVETVKADEPDFAEHTDRASQAFQKAPDLTLQVLRDDRIDHAEEAQILDAIARGANARGTWKRLANEAGERQATARPEAAGLLPSPGRPSGTDAKAEIEVGAAQSEEVGGETAAQEGEESAPPLRIEAVSDKAIIVVGDTKPHKDAIKAAGGRWNTARKGWIFPKSREPQVRQALADLLGGGNAQQPKSDTAVAPQGVLGQGGVAPGDGEAGAGVRVGAGRDGDVAGAGRPDAGGRPTEPVRDGQPERNAALKPRTREQAAAQRRAQQEARDPFVAFLGRFGVSMRHQKDITGEAGRAGNRMLPYYGPMFRKNGLPLDILAQYAVERGFLTQADIDSDTDTGGTRKLAEMIRRAHAREVVGTPMDEEARRNQRMQEESEAQLYGYAASLGIDTEGMSPEDVTAYLEENEEAIIADKANRMVQAAIDEEGYDSADAVILGDVTIDEAARIALATQVNEGAVERAAIAAGEDDIEFLTRIEEIIREAPDAERVAGRGQEVRGSARSEAGDAEEAQAGRGRDAPAQEEGEDFGLTAPTPDEIRRQAQEQERAQQQARQREEAPPAEEFTLTGSNRPADEAAARGQMELGGEAPVDAAAAQAATSPKNDTREPSMTPDEAARYLKDIVYSLSNLDGMTDRAAIILGTGPLAKSGRDRLLMDAFGLTRDQAHEINNRLDSRQPKSLRNEDMQEAFTIFPGLRKVVDDALAEAKPRETRQRITPDAAANMRPGDIIVDEQGREYRAHRARGEFLDAHPIVDGKANVSADTTVRFHLNPETAGAHPDRQAGPVYATGRSLNAQDRQGLTEADRYAQKVDPAAAELADQFIEETKDGDYDGLMATVEQWAKDANVAADDLRQAVLKNIDRLDAPNKQKNAIRLALNPVRAAKQAEKPAADEMLDEARRVAKDGRQGKLKQSLLKSAIERAEAGEIGDLAARLAASKAEIEKQAKKSATEEDANEAELERSAQAIASADSVRVIERKLRDLKESRGKGTSSDLAWGTAGGGNYIRDLRILERALEIAKGEKPAGPIEDVGEQLYANRRNFVGRGLKWDDLAGMNDTLKVKEVKKAKVWPKPDYEKLIAEGMPTVLARMVKQVYDGLGAGPTIRGTPTDADLKRYIDTIGKVREAIFGFTQDKEAVTKFANGVQAIIDRERQSGGVPLMSVMQDAKALADTLLARIWPEEMAKPTSGRFRRGSDANAEALVIGGNRALRALQFDRDDLTKWAKEVAAGWPAKREAWQVQGYLVIAPGDYVVSDEKEVTRYNRQTGEREATGETYFPVAVKGMRRSWMTPTRPAEGAYLLINENGGGLRAFDSEDAAIEAAREITKREKGVGQDNRGTNVSESERTGPARREEGENISSERFKEVFGFRGVNFGREGWIKQAERQEYLNAAYDGLLDLAEILNVPPLAMSLDGMLGIAFGAQGKGQYAAHFVPGHNEINLTKTRGAGSLAHEWGHALDHYFATQAGLAKDDEPMVSEHAHKPDVQERIVRIADRKAVTEKVPTFGDGIRPEIVRAFRSIVQAMEKRPEAESEAASRDELAIAEARRKTDGWLKSVRRHIANMNIGERDALLAEFDGHAAAILEGDTGDGHVSSGKIAVLGRVAAIRDLVKRATGRLLSKDESEGLDLNARFLRNLIAKKGASDTHEPQRMVATDYARESADLDRRKSKSGKKRYWSTPTEMFARAFETYVHERLAAQGQVNTFLTDAEERSRAMIDVPDNSSAMTRGAGQTKQIPAYPYPRGVERETINKAFDTLIGEIKTRPGEKGVAMFSRGDGTGMPIENVTRLAAAVKKAWANAPEVVVVADMADPKIPAEVRDADAEMRASGAEGEPEGFFYGGKVYLVAGALDRPADVVRVMAHESLGHYGLRGLFGDRLMGILAQVANARPREVTAKMREYGLSGAEGRLQAAEEVLAVMAQTNPKRGFVRRAIAAIRTWLRSLGMPLRMTDADIIAQFILPARRFVERGGRAGADGAAFSRRPNVTDTPEFRRWFAGSKVVDSEGRPLVVYHGTTRDFDTFDPSETYDGGLYFTGIADHAVEFAEIKGGESTRVLPVYLSIRNPVVVDAMASGLGNQFNEGWQQALQEMILDAQWKKKHDGIIVRNMDALGYGDSSTMYIAFRPEQIKSVFNRGTFDADNPDIRFSRARTQAANHIADLFQSSKGFNWWHKTLGTQYEKADRNPYFRRAFEAAQSFLNDVSDFANRAADLAPSLLPKMNGIRDVLKRPVPKKDVDAIARPIFDGTLYDSDPARGKVWSDDELRDTYSLNQKQIDLYREFRAAVDKSLDDMGKTDLIRYVGKDADPVRDQVREASSISAAAEILAAHLEQLAQANPKGSHAETAATVRKKAERIEGLKAGGYAPLMRFGRFSVYVTRQDEDGAPEQVYFGMFETQREANRMARQFRDDPTYADAEVTQGVMSQEAFKLFQGVNPDTLELFADVAGIEQTELFQTYLKLAKSNRSAMKRLINRKGVAGFSDDVTRVLASFITSNSRAAAANMNVSEMNAAASEVPKEQGDVKDEAVRLVEFVRGTNDPSSKLRGLLFMQYLGGSVASALVNMTQPLTMTYPYLAQFSGAAKAGAILTKAVKDAVTGVGSDRDLSRALKQAESEGIVSPQEIHHLYSEAGIGLGRNTAIRRATFAWGSMFSAAEQFNRRATFIAAYRIAREQGIADPFAFAEKAVVETQGIYSRANRANWARNPVGATLLTFKQFMIAYLEFLKRLPPKERALAMAVLILVAGLEELPFADDAEDVVDTVAQALGYNWNTARAKREWLAGLLGQQGSEFVLNGLSAVHGMPIDVSARLGLGNLIPGTGLLLGSTRDKSREITEVLGAGGSFAQSALDAGGALLSGDVRKAGEAVAPLAVRNALKGIDMYQTGMYRDTKGRRVMDVDGYDALVKAIGFQPAEVAAKQRKASIVYESVALVKNVEGRIAERWARGVFERDAEAIKAARDELRAWNRTNPEARISIEQSQINRRVRAMRATRAERLAGTAPREIRQAVKESL